jgi:tetratricopeptide (TPR) repeat protein|tara:strand:+ start:24711 stop:25007 length:297 start_codon:yes stop_codon:yes gene_type:complete
VYYQTRVNRLKLIANPNLEQLNDLAVAYVRLKEFAEADDLLNKALQQNPSTIIRYQIWECRLKKQGKFGQGAKFIEQALAIKPEGHMGLGDWYLHALR